MGIFQKSKDNEDMEADDMAQNNSTQINATDDSNRDSRWQKKGAGGSSASGDEQPLRDSQLGNKISSFNYGIEEAVSLMRKLPDVDTDVVITVVRKTLESANVRVDEIIGDAEKKEGNINKRTNTLTSEIEELQKKITLRNKEISILTKDLQETTKVKKLLQQGERDAKATGNSKPPEQSENSNIDANAAPA
jgi:predicted RNase H-like nuclease (RuvC/YqgF family)